MNRLKNYWKKLSFLFIQYFRINEDFKILIISKKDGNMAHWTGENHVYFSQQWSNKSLLSKYFFFKQIKQTLIGTFNFKKLMVFHIFMLFIDKSKPNFG